MNNENLTTEDFKEKLKNTKNAVLLDVRSPEEIAMGTISEPNVSISLTQILPTLFLNWISQKATFCIAEVVQEVDKPVI